VISDRRPLMVSCSAVDSVDCTDTACAWYRTLIRFEHLDQTTADASQASMSRASRLRFRRRQAGIFRLDLLADECRGAAATTDRLAFLEAMMMSLKRPRRAAQRATEPVLVTSAAIAAAVRFPRGVRTLI
jgi:hypothetical protein